MTEPYRFENGTEFREPKPKMFEGWAYILKDEHGLYAAGVTTDKNDLLALKAANYNKIGRLMEVTDDEAAWLKERRENVEAADFSRRLNPGSTGKVISKNDTYRYEAMVSKTPDQLDHLNSQNFSGLNMECVRRGHRILKENGVNRYECDTCAQQITAETIEVVGWVNKRGVLSLAKVGSPEDFAIDLSDWKRVKMKFV